jgi:AraC-like DNA-binding protein
VGCGRKRAILSIVPQPSDLIAVSRPTGKAALAPLLVCFERIHAVERKSAHLVPPHVHQHIELMLPTLGRYRALINGQPGEAPCGGALLVAPGDRHEDATTAQVGFMSVALRILPGPAPDRSRRLLAAHAPVATRVVAAAPELHAIARRLLDGGMATDASQARIQDALAAELLWRLIARLPRNALATDLLSGVEQDDFAAAFSAACARHLCGRPSARILAGELGIAERTLTARCRARLGGAPMHLFRRQQMEHARHLLTAGSSVTETALLLGFANPFHFSAVFRRVSGRPPSHAGIDMRMAGAGMARRRRQR